MFKAYSALAGLYEKLTAYDGNGEWAEYVCKKLSEYAPNKKGIDCACGSGYFTRAEKRAGFDVSGTDISEEMLRYAEENSIKAKLNISYTLQNMENLKTFEKVGFITVINDGINYVKQDRLLKTFCSFNKALISGGILAFDISSEYKLKNIIGNNMFGEDDDDVSYMWFNKLLSDRVVMDLSFFIKEGETYIKKEEHHEQYIHTRESVEQALSAAGFTIKEESGRLGENLSDNSERIIFIVSKVKNGQNI